MKQKQTFFWNSVAFSMIQQMLAVCSLVPLPFQNLACTSESSRFTFFWSLPLRILSVTLLACEMSSVVWWFEHFFDITFLWDWNENCDLFQSCSHYWVFQICWHIEHSTLTASSFRILNSSTGIPSPPLALLVVMFPKAPLTSHSRMSGSRWVTTPTGVLFCVFVPPLLNIFSFY